VKTMGRGHKTRNGQPLEAEKTRKSILPLQGTSHANTFILAWEN
jgi:hypothetical protein